MPAYFSIRTEMNTVGVDSYLVRDFYNQLIEAGVIFLSGYWRSEGFTYDEQIKINQDYLNHKNQEDGPLHQAQFQFNDFSEVRGYWYFHDDVVVFNLLIPEEDFVEYTDVGVTRHRERMDEVRDLFVRLWEFPSIVAIQTHWECSDIPLLCRELSPKAPPQTEPFSIIHKAVYHHQWGIAGRDIIRNGILLERVEHWFPV